MKHIMRVSVTNNEVNDNMEDPIPVKSSVFRNYMEIFKAV